MQVGKINFLEDIGGEAANKRTSPLPLLSVVHGWEKFYEQDGRIGCGG
jgi:hypothetical protein